MKPERPFAEILKALAEGAELNPVQAGSAFEAVLSGTPTPVQTAAFLTALRVRGETVAEITAGAQALRARMVRVTAPDGAIDTCGTGGDGLHTLNISTAVALVVAACGVPVAKHGNRAASSRSGAADVLAALGVRIELTQAEIARCFAEAGLCFLFAPAFHPAMRAVAPVRADLGFRTVFNLLGPLANPAGVRRQLVGVFATRWVTPLAEVLGALGAEQAMVVHGADGMDEVSLSGPSTVALWRDGAVRSFEIVPDEAGLTRAPVAALKGGDAKANAAALMALLKGRAGPYRDIVLLNAAAALMVADRAEDLRAGVALARAALDDGAALARLERLVAAAPA